MEWAIREAEALALPCYDLVPASQGDQVAAYWGGRRSDLPEELPASVGAIRSRKHILSVDSTLFDALGLKGRGPFALAVKELRDGSERAVAMPVSSGDVTSIRFDGAVPLKAVESISLPPLEAVLLYGGPTADDWLKSRGLRRWEYQELTDDDTRTYRSYFYQSSPLMSDSPPFARVGGWHIIWSDDGYYIPREMRLMLWTFEDSEPWYEVFLTGMLNYVVKERIT
jgi:hypothetical protein